MEVYANEHPDIDLLSIMFKHAVYNGVTEISGLDPYIMMYRKIEQYLKTRQEKERLELFRKCFYFKINIRMGQRVRNENSNWRREIMQNVMQDWKWNGYKLKMLDRKDIWKIDTVVYERRALIKSFTTSYHFLSDFARKHAEVSRITQSELHILGRKLYAAFERKAGKVEIVNRGIAPDTLEAELTICQVRKKDGQDKWLLYRGNISFEETRREHPLKIAQSAIELLAWSYFNRIIGTKTAISAITLQSTLSAKNIKDILSAFEELFPEGEIPKPTFNDLNHPAYINVAGLFINIGIKHLLAKDRTDMHISSNRIDALSYGGFHDNLAKTFDLVVATSWEELLIFRYEGTDGLLKCISDYTRFAPVTNNVMPAKVNGYSVGSHHASYVARRMEELFAALINTYYHCPDGQYSRYIFIIEDDYFITEYRDGTLEFKKSTSVQELIRNLSAPRPEFSPVVFDPKVECNFPLPEIYRLNKPATIQTYFYVENQKVCLYILDERGSLITMVMPFYDYKSLINHLRIFFVSITKRRNILLTDDCLRVEEIATEFYRLTQEKDKSYSAKLIDKMPDSDHSRYFNIQVLGDLDENRQSSLTIYCEDHEFSTLEYGQNIFTAVVKHIIKQRKDSATYPIYITDIDLSRNLFFLSDIKNLQTIHYLEYKKRIETKLNATLSSF